MITATIKITASDERWFREYLEMIADCIDRGQLNEEREIMGSGYQEGFTIEAHKTMKVGQRVRIVQIVDVTGDPDMIGCEGKITDMVENDVGASPEDPLYTVDCGEAGADQFWGEELSVLPEDAWAEK